MNQEEYAKLWLETNRWEIPQGFEPDNNGTELNAREKELVAHGMWKILQKMVTDGIISVHTLNATADKLAGDKPGTAKITRY